MQLAPYGMMLIELLCPGLLFFMVELNKLRSANELKGSVTRYLTPKQINELATNRSIPHYELINPLTGMTSAWFIREEVEGWLINYFVKYDFKLMPEIILVNFAEDDYKIHPTDIVPAALSFVKPLYKLPIKNLNTPPGVYFLCHQNEIVYVGMAANIGSRFLKHKGENKKEFDSVYFICCHLDQLSKIEAACIKHFKPKYNIALSECILTTQDKDILEKIIMIP